MAVQLLGGLSVEQWNGTDLLEKMAFLANTPDLDRVFAPSLESSHPDHIAVGAAAKAVFGPRLTQYHTYIDGAKVRSEKPVPFEPLWVQTKLLALTCYVTQLQHPRANQFFRMDLDEYYA